MKVVEKTETDVICRVENGGAVKDRKGVNVPGVHLSMPYMSAQGPGGYPLRHRGGV